MNKKKLISLLLGCAMCGCVTIGLALTASAEESASTPSGGSTEYTITINLGDGFMWDSTNSAAKEDTTVTYTTLAETITFTHEIVQQIFSYPVYGKISNATYNPNSSDYKNKLSSTLFGLKDENDTLYRSGDTLTLNGDVTLTCYYDGQNRYTSTEQKQQSWDTDNMTQGINSISLNKDTMLFLHRPYPANSGFKAEYTADELQPFYHKLIAIDQEAFQNSAVTEKIELPDTVEALCNRAFKNASKLYSLTGLENVKAVGGNVFESVAKDVTNKEVRYTFGEAYGLKSGTFNSMTIAKESGKTYRWLFTGTINGDKRQVISSSFISNTTIHTGNMELDYTSMDAIVYVPYGQSDAWYIGPSAYKSENIFKVTANRANIPMREMYAVSFNLSGGNVNGATTLGATYMDARAVSVTRNDVQVNMFDDAVINKEGDTITGGYSKNPAAQDLTLLKAEKPENPTKEGYTFLHWIDQKGNVWDDNVWNAGGFEYEYGTEGVQLTAVWGHKDPAIGEHTYETNGKCACGEKVEFDVKTLALGTDTSLLLGVDKTVANGYTHRKVEATFNGKNYTLSEVNLDANKYVYEFDKIGPAFFGENLTVTFSLSMDGETWISAGEQTFSVKDYCYDVLNNKTEVNYVKTVVADLLNYGAATQVYSSQNVNALVNADMTEEQKAFATSNAPTVTDETKLEGEEKLVKWENATLELNSSIAIKLMFSTQENVNELNVVATIGIINVATSVDTIEYNGTKYVVTIDGLNATKLNKSVQVYVAKGEERSQTLTYSIQSFAKKVEASTDLGNLAVAMMKYVNSASAYFETTEAPWGEAKTMQYGDVLPYADATILEGEGVVLSKNDDNFTAISVGTAVLYANGKRIQVTVTPAVVDVVLFTGQSNMRGSDSATSYTADIPAGQAYEFLYNAGEKYDSEPNPSIKPVSNNSLDPVGEDMQRQQVWNTTNDPTEGLVQKSQGSTIVPKFVEQYTKGTGRKIAVVHVTKGGHPLENWGDGGNMELAISKKYGAAVEYFTDNPNFEVGKKFYLMFQGESDSVASDGEVARYSEQSYYDYFNSFHKVMTEELGMEFGALFYTGRDSTVSIDGIKAVNGWKKALAEGSDTIILCSDSAPLFNQDTSENNQYAGYLKEKESHHFNANGMQVLAIEAATSIINYLGYGEDSSLKGKDPVEYILNQDPPTLSDAEYL